MHKKYIIEKKDLDLLPYSYHSLGIIYSSNFDKINKTLKKIKDAKNLINELNITLNSLTNDNIKLYNQLKFIKKNYVPKLYLNLYTKNNKPIKYVNLIIKYFNFSKTIYLGRKSDILNLLSSLKINFSNKNFKPILFNYLKPIILDKCSSIKNQHEFINLKLTSRDLFKNFSEDLNVAKDTSFSSYLKQFE